MIVFNVLYFYIFYMLFFLFVFCSLWYGQKSQEIISRYITINILISIINNIIICTHNINIIDILAVFMNTIIIIQIKCLLNVNLQSIKSIVVKVNLISTIIIYVIIYKY